MKKMPSLSVSFRWLTVSFILIFFLIQTTSLCAATYAVNPHYFETKDSSETELIPEKPFVPIALLLLEGISLAEGLFWTGTGVYATYKVVSFVRSKAQASNESSVLWELWPSTPDPNAPEDPSQYDWQWVAISIASLKLAAEPAEKWLRDIIENGWSVYKLADENGKEVVRTIVQTSENSFVVGIDDQWATITIPKNAEPIVVKASYSRKQVSNLIHQAQVNSVAWKKGLEKMEKIIGKVDSALQKGVEPKGKDIRTIQSFVSGDPFDDKGTIKLQKNGEKTLNKIYFATDYEYLEEAEQNGFAWHEMKIISALVRLCDLNEERACELLEAQGYEEHLASVHNPRSVIPRGLLAVMQKHHIRDLTHLYALGKEGFKKVVNNDYQEGFLPIIKDLFESHTAFDYETWLEYEPAKRQGEIDIYMFTAENVVSYRAIMSSRPAGPKTIQEFFEQGKKLAGRREGMGKSTLKDLERIFREYGNHSNEEIEEWTKR